VSLCTFQNAFGGVIRGVNGKRRLVFRQTNSAVEAVDEIQPSTALIGEHGPQIVDGASSRVLRDYPAP
jgi:hypothetical protein